MTVMQTIDEQLSAVLSTKEVYTNYEGRWRYLLQSYLGGQDWRDGANLTQYQMETATDYVGRLNATAYDNHVQSVVKVWNSFLFREEPHREFGTLENDARILDMLRDADRDDRSMNQFMKDVSTWSSVFGHCWVIISKPNMGALTVADELALDLRPYLNLITPLAVIDWIYERQANGSQILTYLKYIEDFNDSQRTIKEWTRDTVRTYTVDIEDRTFSEDETVINELGEIPAVTVYHAKSPVRGIGVSAVTDIADINRMIYNINSEIEQSIRVDSHPSLVKTPETQAGIGAGSIIHMPDNLDPGLKPYLLQYSGAEVGAMLEVKRNLIDAIDKIANTGAIRAVESRTLSGVAMQTEFQLLNARLSEMADNLELAEEQIWQWVARYLGREWTGHVEYPGSFNIRDVENNMATLQTARNTATDPGVLKVIDYQILELLGVEEPARVLTNDGGLPAAYVPATTPGVPAGENCANCSYYDPITQGCSKWDATVDPVYWCRAWEGRIEESIEEMQGDQ
jgi:hypothetical protein